MTEAQTLQAAQNVVYLAKCAVNGEIPDLTGIGDTEAVYAYAAQHKLTAAVAMALESAGQKDKRSNLAIANALKRKLFFEKAAAQVEEELEKAGIWFLPLKGMILKEYYPKPGMREMGDHDILFDAARAEAVKAIMEGLGYATESFGSSHHDCYCKPPFLRFEMHRELFEPIHGEKLYGYYRDVEKRLLGDGCEKHLSPEDFYLFMTAHEYKHYADRGTGLRSLLDTYVVLQKTAFNMDYVSAEAEKLGMAEFEAQNRSLAQHLFSGGKMTASDMEMLEYILSSGTYGTWDHRVQNRLSRLGYGKLRYAWERLIEPFNKNSWNYQTWVRLYPFFYRHKILLPFLMVPRIIHLKTDELQAEVKAFKNAKG